MAIILGEHDSNGKYSWFGDEDIIQDGLGLEEDFSESPVDLHILSQSTYTPQVSNTPTTFTEDNEQDNNNGEDEDIQMESTTRKRH
jgi:hypothetical protein